MSQLRRGQWPVKYAALKAAAVGKQVNKSTGRQAMHFECALCLKAFPQKEVKVDHIDTVVPLEGFENAEEYPFGYDWNSIVDRLFCELDGFQVLCKPCHDTKSNRERTVRSEYKTLRKSRENPQLNLFS